MGLVVLRGAVCGELAGEIALEAIFAMLVFAAIGATAGWIADQLVRDSMENLFRARVDWYRRGLIDAGYIKEESVQDD
jgi:hypothetical protein